MEIMKDGSISAHILESLCNSAPTDRFVLDKESYIYLVDKFAKTITPANSSPHGYSADIFLSNTIPIYDCLIGRSTKENVRIVIFKEDVDKLTDLIKLGINKMVAIGAVISEEPGASIAIPIGFDTKALEIIPIATPVVYGSKEFKNIVKEEYVLNDWINMFHSFFTVWYALQLSMLHPQIKLSFSHPQREKIKKAQYKKNMPKEYVRIKRHVVDASAFEAALYCDTGHREYSCLCWWVRGHFRERLGKKEFVCGYWKGPLRETKNQSLPRECKVGDMP